jgi:hypothetical protein
MESKLEHILTHSYKEGMIAFVEAHPEVFDELVQLTVSNNQPYSWRASWLLWSVMEENDGRVRHSIQKIMDVLPTLKDGQQRELFKILYKMELDEDYEGLVFNLCVDAWEKIHKQPSLRLNAFQLILKIATKHPDLQHEILLLTQEQYMETLSKGVRHSIAKLVKNSAD